MKWVVHSIWERMLQQFSRASSKKVGDCNMLALAQKGIYKFPGWTFFPTSSFHSNTLWNSISSSSEWEMERGDQFKALFYKWIFHVWRAYKHFFLSKERNDKKEKENLSTFFRHQFLDMNAHIHVRTWFLWHHWTFGN
jgi:hypothetical protein